MALPQEVVTSKTGTLAQRIKVGSSVSTLDIDVTENWDITSGVVRVNIQKSREWFSFTGLTVVVPNERIRLTGVVRALKKNAVDFNDADSSLEKDHAIGAHVVYVLHSTQINNFSQSGADTTYSGDNTFTGTNTFQSTTQATVIHQNVTTAERDALTGVQDGAIIFNTTLGEVQMYLGGAWFSLASGSVQPDATETTAGKVELATVADMLASAVTGESGAPLVVQAKNVTTTSGGAGDAGKIPLLNASGKFESSVFPSVIQKFSGDGSDGDVSGAVSITGSNNTYIVKNYNNFAPGANTVSIVPTGCILHIRVKGNCDVTNTFFDFKGKGTQGGTGGAAINPPVAPGYAPGNPGTSGSNAIGVFPMAKGGTGCPSAALNLPGPGGAGGTQEIPITASLIIGANTTIISPSTGGGGGSSGTAIFPGPGGPFFSGAGGNGGAGGGCLILEVGGDLTFSGTTFDFRGNDGSIGGNSVAGGDSAGGGGGGGGSGGSLFILYNGTLTGSPTVQITGGAGGVGGSGVGASNRGGGGGGGGGASMSNNGVAGSPGTATVPSNGGAGGTGATGVYILQKNTTFQ